MSKAKKKLSKAQVRIASEVLANTLKDSLLMDDKKRLRASAKSGAKALLAGLRLISKASRNKQ